MSTNWPNVLRSKPEVLSQQPMNDFDKYDLDYLVTQYELLSSTIHARSLKVSRLRRSSTPSNCTTLMAAVNLTAIHSVRFY